MNNHSVTIIGLPASGKTTFLAALWHLICARDIETVLRFHSLKAGDSTHLNQIAARWRDAIEQDHTVLSGTRLVSMSLKNANDIPVDVTFPDVPGEAYRDMWENRDCTPEISEILKTGNVLLFIHADTIKAPRWVINEVAQMKGNGLEMEEGKEVAWHPKLAPTQVQLVDLLQLLSTLPLDVGPRKLGIIFSAWDKAKGEGLAPNKYLEDKLPLLSQYLSRNADGWNCRTYGLSAQGCEYDDPTDPNKAKKQEAEEIRLLDRPSDRIELFRDETITHDLTEPLAWLME